jgi:hypothetical protein
MTDQENNRPAALSCSAVVIGPLMMPIACMISYFHITHHTIRQMATMLIHLVRQNCFGNLAVETPNLFAQHPNFSCCQDKIVCNILNCGPAPSALINARLDGLCNLFFRDPRCSVIATFTQAAVSAAREGLEDKSIGWIVCPTHKHPTKRQADISSPHQQRLGESPHANIGISCHLSKLLNSVPVCLCGKCNGGPKIYVI